MNDIKLNVTTKKINPGEAKLKEIKKQKPEIAMVFGAGIINNNRPSKILKDRLNIAASLYKNKIIKKILNGHGEFIAEYLVPILDMDKETIRKYAEIPYVEQRAVSVPIKNFVSRQQIDEINQRKAFLAE